VGQETSHIEDMETKFSPTFFLAVQEKTLVVRKNLISSMQHPFLLLNLSSVDETCLESTCSRMSIPLGEYKAEPNKNITNEFMFNSELDSF
jgi:hypothetical protein